MKKKTERKNGEKKERRAVMGRGGQDELERSLFRGEI